MEKGKVFQVALEVTLECELQPIAQTIYRNDLKMDYKSEHKSQSYNMFRENILEDFYDLELCNHSLDTMRKG